MPESENAAALALWTAPQCPFTIEYAPRALDDIRLAVADAFFSLPRGGAEIGGVLFGTWHGGRLTITDYAALDCEHAFGPSFTLSPPDEARLADLLSTPSGNGLQPVGWYHSHTRSEIFLSDADQEIHRRFFPEPWQVALVLKPHTFQPTRAGFFFRGAGGQIHAEASYNEFVLTPLLVQPAPSGLSVAALPDPAPLPVAPAPMPASQPVEPDQPQPAPQFLDRPQPSPSRWPKVIICFVAGGALGAAAYVKRDLWLPRMLAIARRQAPAAAVPPPLGLNLIDSNGQLQIRWNPNFPALLQASGGILSIDTGAATQQIALDKAHLLSGAFTFARQTERVDVSLGIVQRDGHASHEVTTFMGKLPDQKPVEDPALQQQRDKLSQQVAKMQSDLDAEIARNAKLRETVDQLSKQLRDQQRSRLLNQAPDKK
jgi:proteasome lid subunit RPN8/RPN11